ncbi:hypothetical protein BDZ45DRAFT_742261 [Acephala macrosclerotiorum]|nr:hypothetical protein BDZ45DRAFT_742261 [Acephala macrosclerotiorum]
MSQSPFSASDLDQYELDRKRLLLFPFLASGFPTGPEHDKRLKEQARLAEQAAQASRPIQSPLMAGYDTSTISQRPQKQLPIEDKIKICSSRLQRWIELTAKFDTGTQDDWISISIVKDLQLAADNDELVVYETFTGEVMESSMVVRNLAWSSIGTDSRSWATTFRIAPENAPFQVLFGSDFIESKQIYSFNKANLILTRKRGTKEDNRVRQQREARAEAEADELERQRRGHDNASGQANGVGGKAQQSRIKVEEKEKSDMYYDDEMERDD